MGFTIIVKWYLVGNLTLNIQQMYQWNRRSSWKTEK